MITIEADGNSKITGCVFTENSGGGVASISEHSHFLMENSTIERNFGQYMIKVQKNSTVTVIKTIHANNSKAISALLQSLTRQSLFEVTSNSYLHIEMSQIDSNDVIGIGSVFYLQNNATLKAQNVIVRGNNLRQGSAGYCEGQSTFIWTNVTFSDNHAHSALVSSDCKVNLYNSYVVHNQMTHGSRGLVASVNDMLQVSCKVLLKNVKYAKFVQDVTTIEISHLEENHIFLGLWNIPIEFFTIRSNFTF